MPYLDIFETTSYLIQAFFTPVTSGAWWFLASYVFLMLMTSTINEFINSLNALGRTKLLFLSWVLWYSIPMLFGTIFFQLQRAIFFYLLGAFFRFKEKNKGQHIGFYIGLTVLGWALYGISSYYATERLDSSIISKLTSILENSFAVPICSYALFKIFLSINIKNNNFINEISATTLGIYLIHESLVGRNLIWYKIINPLVTQYESRWFLLKALASIFIVFFVCSAMDELRRKFIEPYYTKWYIRLKELVIFKYYNEMK